MATSQYVTQQYQELLGRAPDAGGLAHYLRYSDPNAVRTSIMGSAEYKARSATPAPTPTPATTPLVDFAAKSKAESDALLASQNQQQESLFGNYDAIRKNQEALPALYGRLQTEAGIPQLGEQAQIFKNEIYKTKDLLDKLKENITTRTAGSLTNEAQVNRMNAYEGDTLRNNLGRLGTGLAPIADMLTSANSSVATQLGLQTQQQDRELEPIKLRINAISDRFAREITGFNAAKETSLSAILDKLQRDRVLSDRDWQLAQDLAAEERAFSRQKALASQQLNSYNTGSTTDTPTPTKTTPSVDIKTYLNSGAAPAGNFAGSLNYNANAGSNIAKLIATPITTNKASWLK